ncbi:hypothetical protein FRB94_005648 [Tulasnella sp. JGI-2019a]|nr:hypothetical protein FRB94_005648 [Tulasnella sp. JGI-2019a]KAG9007256.1 hypothetical protein FRB93_008079 [Tulasnella sp. JGI-2019a]KAG9033564.1 hypothetical protein FRB95_014642 [Tulasnella sp. JGI-2019a]
MTIFLSGSDESEPAISIGVGITVGLLAAFIQSLGLTIQRKSHVLNQEAPESEQKVEHRRPLWLLGFGIFISSNILGSIFQIASLPVVILAPLGAVSLLWNALFARLILGDLFSKFMILGTLLIVAGAVLIARFGIVPEPTHSLEDLLALFRRDAFVVYFSLLGAAVFITLIVTHIAEWSVYRRIRVQSRIMLPESDDEGDSSRSGSPIPLTPSNNAFQIESERTPLLDRKRATSPSEQSIAQSPLQAYRRTLNMIAVSYASASGIISGMCLIFAKSGVELVLLTLSGKNQFWRWESWALVGTLGVFALLQLWYLHKSLILADPTLVCPLAFCFYNVSTIFNGLIYYDQLQLLTPLHLGLVVLGMVVLLGGVYAVSIQTEEEEGRDGDWLPADEEGVGPAVAPTDVVRIVERITGTVPSEDHGLPELVLSPPTERHHGSPVRKHHKSASIDLPPHREEDFPSLSPISDTMHSRPPARSSTGVGPRHRSAYDQLPSPLRTSGFPQYSPLQSPEVPPPVIPGLQIGFSAVSPGWPAWRRRRDPHQHPPALSRRSISEGLPVEDGERSPVAERRRASIAESDISGHAVRASLNAHHHNPHLLESPDDGRSGWLSRVVAWRPVRRKDQKNSVEGEEGGS